MYGFSSAVVVLMSKECLKKIRKKGGTNAVETQVRYTVKRRFAVAKSGCQ
jgi:hypothetical protein